MICDPRLHGGRFRFPCPSQNAPITPFRHDIHDEHVTRKFFTFIDEREKAFQYSGNIRRVGTNGPICMHTDRVDQNLKGKRIRVHHRTEKKPRTQTDARLQIPTPDCHKNVRVVCGEIVNGPRCPQLCSTDCGAVHGISRVPTSGWQDNAPVGTLGGVRIGGAPRNAFFETWEVAGFSLLQSDARPWDARPPNNEFCNNYSVISTRLCPFSHNRRSSLSTT